ncbi:hypothetical protein ACFQFG_05910 [Methylobacterium persicinum]
MSGKVSPDENPRLSAANGIPEPLFIVAIKDGRCPCASTARRRFSNRDGNTKRDDDKPPRPCDDLRAPVGDPGLAAGKRGNADLRRFCSGDAATFCGDLDPHSKKMDACFAAHRRELSDNCRRAIDAYQARGGK